MKLSFTDADQWYEAYESAPLKRRYEILIETLDQALSEDFIEKSGLATCLLEMLDELDSRNLIEQLLSFISEVQTKQPALYRDKYLYFDSFLVKYYLYRDDKEKVAESLARFMEDPVQGIDYMFPLLNYIRFYGYTDIAAKLCKKTYLPVRRSPKLIPGSDFELGYLIFIDIIGTAYQHIRSGKVVDWETLVREAEKYGYGGGQENAADIHGHLMGELEGGAAFAASFRADRENSTYALTWAFLKHMLEQKGMPFICSNHIINGVLEFLAERGGKKSMSPSSYFAFSRSELDSYLARMMGGLMSMQQARGIGTLWGSVYLYDFLLSREIITDSMHRKIIKTVDVLKKDVIKAFRKSLWKYDFVHRWTPPDSISDDDFAAESELFAKTSETQEPLGDELPRRPMNMFSQPTGKAEASGPAPLLEPIKFPSTDRKPAGKESGAREFSGTKKPNTPKIGRNAPCHCGSGKKYKKCCINKDKLAVEPAPPQDEDVEFYDDMEDVIGELLKDVESNFSPEELKLYDTFDEIKELMDDENRTHEAARKFLEATDHIQDIPDDFPWDMGGIAGVLLEDLRMDDPSLAIEVMRRTIVLDPENASAWQLDMAEIMIESGEADEGLAILHRLAEESPDNIRCWVSLGKSYLEIKDYGKAEEYLQRAIAVGEAQKEDSHIAWDIGESYTHLFDVYRETDLIEEAIQAWQKAAHQVNIYQADVSRVCDMLIEKGDLKRAEEFTGMIENSMEQNYQRGRIRFLQGNEKEGLQHWNAVLSEANSDIPTTWPEVALRLSRHDLVIKLLPDFLDLIPRSVHCRCLLSLAYVMDSDMESAQRVLMDAPRKVELPDELRQLCEELPFDEQNRIQWLEMFSSD